MNPLTNLRHFVFVRRLAAATVWFLIFKGLLWFVAPFVFIWAI